MQGAIYFIPHQPGTPHRYVPYDHPISLKDVEALVGEPVELIPELETVQQRGALRSCLAYAPRFTGSNPEDVNQWANVLWRISLSRKYGPKHCDPQHTLTGNVVVVSGDEEFLDAL